MPNASVDTVQMEAILKRLNAGELAARDELIVAACERLEAIAGKMLRRFPRVRAQQQTADVLQSAILRLRKALLKNVGKKVLIDSIKDFFCFSTALIRNQLIDFARACKQIEVLSGPEPAGHDVSELEDWAEFHTQAAKLPPKEREVFDLLWYQEKSQHETAQILGVSERTVKRLWQSCKDLLKIRIRSCLGIIS